MPKIHRGICPDKACELVGIEVKRQKSEREAFRVVAEELGVSFDTVKSWAFRNKMGATAPNETKSTPGHEDKTCATIDLYTLKHDSGKKKFVFKLRENDGNRFLVIQEYRVGKAGKEIATKNRLIMGVDLFSQFRGAMDQVEMMLQERCSGKPDVDVPDPQEDDQAEPPVVDDADHEEDDEVELQDGDDAGNAQEHEQDDMQVATGAPLAPADGTEDTEVGVEPVQCVDCVHFVVNKGAPEQNGACNPITMAWNGKAFQSPHKPHLCQSFSPRDQQQG
jgi:hypothetical protein